MEGGEIGCRLVARYPARRSSFTFGLLSTVKEPLAYSHPPLLPNRFFWRLSLRASDRGSTTPNLRRLAHHREERLRAAVVRVQPQRSEAVADQHLEIAACLGREERAEAEGLPRHRQVVAAVDGQLDEEAVLRPSLVQLPGRVEEARAEAAGGGEPGRVPHRALQLAQLGRELVVRRDVGEQRHVVSGLAQREVGR